MVDDEQLFIFDSENRHLLRVTVINYTVSMRSMGFTENDVQKLMASMRFRTVSAGRFLMLTSALVIQGTWSPGRSPTFPERLSHNRIKHGSTTVDPYKKWSKKI